VQQGKAVDRLVQTEPRSEPIERSMLPKLCEEVRTELRLIFWRYRVPPSDAEDLLQTVLTLALMRWEEIREPARWLVGTLENRCVMYWRERHRRDRRYESLMPFHEELAVPVPAPQERRRVLAELAHLSRKLPAQQRRVLALRFGLGCSSDEIAAASGLARGSVRKTLNRALHRLRRAATAMQAPGGRIRPPVEPLVADPAGADDGAAEAWAAAVEAFLSDRVALAPETLRRHRRCLAAAGVELGFPAPEELRRQSVAEYRALLIAEGASEGRIEAAIAAMRSFLKWAAPLRRHARCLPG
jgi:RNA polymerase sigma factor (sigma-70 family)